MSKYKDTSPRRNNPERNNTKDVATKSTNDNEDTHYNRAPNDNEQRTKATTDPLDDRNPLQKTPSIDGQDWKCRECGFTNQENKTVCETCKIRKPMRPRLETRLSYTKRLPSSSPSDRRSPSLEKETMFNRAGSPSPSPVHRQNSSREQSPSKSKTSGHRSRGHRKSSHSNSSDDNQNQYSGDTTGKKRSSKASNSDSDSVEKRSPGESASSDKRHRERLEDEYKSRSKKTTSDTSSSDYQSHEYNKSSNRLRSEKRSSSPPPAYGSLGEKSSVRSPTMVVDQDDYQIKKSPKNVSSRETSKRDPARSPSPKVDDREGLHASSPYDKDHRLTRGTSKQKMSPERFPKERSPTGHGSHEYSKSGSRLYPELHPSSTSVGSVSHKDEDTHNRYTSTGEKSLVRSSASHQNNDYRSTQTPIDQRKPSQGSSSSKVSNRDDSIVVYIPDLPPNIESNQLLENMISECLERRHKQKVLDVKCNSELGIGIVYLHNDEDKRNVLNTIEKIMIESGKNTTVSFVNELELISYVVIYAKHEKDIPSEDDICRRWAHLYKVHSQPNCEKLSAQFPNIFRVITYSLHELIDAMSIKDFSINNQLAAVYFRADCCFFEDLPRATNLDRLKEAISRQISDKYMSKDSIYIGYNKDGANAVVLTTGRTRIWALHNSIRLDGREIMKKDSLACRLLIKNVPKSISASLIKDHKIFANSVVKTLPSSEHVILELSDRKVYEQCIDQGALRINEHVLGIEVYTVSSNPEDKEIDAENWYETEMCDHKPDIMPFMSDPQHAIFRLKWNSQAFLEQFHLWKSKDRKVHEKEKDKEKDEKLYNLKRHLLRMTVMLNTIGIVKKGSYRIGEKEIKLKSDRLKTILYNHKSKLQRSKTTSLSQATQTPYASTSIKVVNEDCLIVYKNLVSKGYRPVILNMANANSPGGGYKRGDGAQEETLFRRSNYYQSLDLTLDDGKPSARFYCNSNCDLDPFEERDELYPMDDFGAIYTSGLTVFRQPEENTGYSFMDIPMYDVCSIAMAAYRDPKLDNKNLLTPKYSIGTRKKIENIFAIAHHHKHDSLVLSALGCGAFRNPPEHIATIFKSVIEQYAGYFKCIYFAIIDDHNSHQDLNPTGNCDPFQKIFDINNSDFEPKRQKIVDMMIGPWRILNQTTNKEVALSDIRICYLKPCQHGGKCNDLKNDQHCREYSHPPLCPYADNMKSCKEKNDDQHMLWFRHRAKCSSGGECELIENDPIHSNEFEHPEFCRDAGNCENMDHEHLKSYRHVPLCKHRHQCVEYNSKSYDHCQKFRHCIPMCRFGHFCVRFHDTDHMNEENHPFQLPCPFTPFHCRAYNALSETRNIKSLPFDIQNHCLKYSHVCRYGRQCHESADIHWKNTIHVARHACSDGDQCAQLHNEDHLNSFSHPGIADIRRLCTYQGYDCRDKRKPEHIRQHRHDGNHDRSGVIGCFGQNKDINFVENQENIVKTITDYVKTLNSRKTLSIPSEPQKWIKGLQPIHRCSKAIFESILVHGHVMSREHMDHLKKSYFAAQAVQEHKHVQAVFDHYKKPILEEHAKEYIRAIVSLEYSKKYDAAAVAAAGALGTSTSAPSDEYDATIRLKERFLRNMIEPKEMDTIRKCAVDIAEASWNLHNTPTGIKYPPDKLLGTDKHVFSILGPHFGHHYGDIFLVFKSDVMLHPDANFSPQAGTSFVSGRTFTLRPWVTDPGAEAERIKCFHNSKLHCSVPGYEYAAAAELMAITGLHNKTMDGDVRAILNRWKKTESHQVFEAHLPQLVPLDYVEEIFIPKNTFASLTPAAQESVKKIFRDSLHITNHEVTLPSDGATGPPSLDKTRIEYQNFVNDKLIEKFQKRMERARNLSGIAITLAPSQFTDHIVLPLTINEAHDQHRRTHKRDPNCNDVYIYWQAMYGDMMLTLSDEPIDPDTSQPDIRCLVCYIAEKPSTTTTNYSESYTYLNAGEPYKHGVILSTPGRCSASSSSFHRGCNIEDFLTYCLKIEKKTGQVTLSHAGPNSIYCHETVKCRFAKTNLDLNKLKHIHVSAGSQKVPIRNLIISFEQIHDLHPSFDKNFKRGDDAFRRQKQSQNSDHSPSRKRTPSPREKSPSVISKVIDGIGRVFGYDGAGKKLEPCPNSINCRLQESSNHTKEYSHPCPYAERCRNKDKEPHLTHEPHQTEQCSPRNRRDGSDCHVKTSDHREKHSRDEQIEVKNNKTYETSHKSSTTSHSQYGEKSSSYAEENDERIRCRHGRDCYEKNDRQHCSKYSHPDEFGSRSSDSLSRDQKTPCRHGRDCYDKNDRQHCSKYSHPDEYGSRSSDSSSFDQKIPCRHGRDCYNKNDRQHCSEYSHPDEFGSRSSDSSSRDQKILCRHGRNCRDKNDPQHCSKYSHPNK